MLHLPIYTETVQHKLSNGFLTSDWQVRIERSSFKQSSLIINFANWSNQPRMVGGTRTRYPNSEDFVKGREYSVLDRDGCAEESRVGWIGDVDGAAVVVGLGRVLRRCSLSIAPVPQYSRRQDSI